MSSNFTLSLAGPNILFIYSLATIHFQLCFLWAHKSLFHHIVQLSVYPRSRFEFSHTLSLPATTASYFLYYLLVGQLSAKELYFCSFVTKANQASTKYSPYVFNSFYRTVTHGEYHRIFTSPSSNLVSPHFTILETLPSVVSPFFSLKNSKAPPKDTQYFNRFWQASSPAIFPLQKKFPFWSPIFFPTLEHLFEGSGSFSRLWCPSFNRIRALTDLFIKNFLFQLSPRFFIFEPPKKIPQKGSCKFNSPPPSLHPSKHLFQEVYKPSR